jgi:hypothetical protein
MISLKKTLVLSVLAAAMLATPAFAQRQHRQEQSRETTNTLPQYSAPHYPYGGVNGSGNEQKREFGAQFNLGY